MYWQLLFFGGLGWRNYLREETIQGRKLITIRRPWLPKIFNEGKYSRVETIWGNSRFESKYVVFISEKDRDSAVQEKLRWITAAFKAFFLLISLIDSAHCSVLFISPILYLEIPKSDLLWHACWKDIRGGLFGGAISKKGHL